MDWNAEDRSDLEATTRAFVKRVYEVAQGPIHGFNDTAAALATEANRDRGMIERARREVLSRLRADPDHVTKQAASLIQRALELGDWDWN
jgi:hypothetical protein